MAKITTVAATLEGIIAAIITVGSQLALREVCSLLLVSQEGT